MMKITLSLKQRILFFNTLNSHDKATVADWRAINEDLKKLAFTEAETTEYEIVQDANTLRWNPEKEGEPKEYKINNRSYDIVKNIVVEADKKGTLHKSQLDLAELFID